MLKEFFSERELGKKPLTSEDVDLPVYNGIIALYIKYLKGFSKDFPEYCDDSPSTVCDVNNRLLVSTIEANIPDLNDQLGIIHDEDDLPNKYAILDFVEFCYENISDYDEYYHHDYFRHFHLSFPDTTRNKESFRKEVNRLFERNGIVFFLNEDGLVKRYLPLELDRLISTLEVNTADERLNELIHISISSISDPKIETRVIALEKIWDSFERMKTYYSEKKKESASKLIMEVAGKTDKFDELLDYEFKELTRIGNSFQIRHFEKDKIQIKSLYQIDYLYYRMIALIHLCIRTLNL